MPQRSKAEVYLHFVWATYRRMPLVAAHIEPRLYACIMDEVRKMGCETLAIGGMPEHVHLAVQIPPRIAPAKLMQQVKGVSSAAGRDLLAAGELFGWQDGYGVFSFSRSHRAKVIGYIQNQKRHHREGNTWSEWEKTSEDVATR